MISAVIWWTIIGLQVVSAEANPIPFGPPAPAGIFTILFELGAST